MPGAGRGSLEMKKLLGILDDGEWHLRDEVKNEIMKVVPPGMAIRDAERARRAAAGAPEKRQKHRTTAELVHIGANNRAADVINSAALNKRIEKRVDEDGIMWLRILRRLPAVLVIRSNGDTTIVTNSTVSVVEVDFDKLNSMSIEELKELRRLINTLPLREPELYEAKTRVNVALTLREFDDPTGAS